MKNRKIGKARGKILGKAIVRSSLFQRLAASLGHNLLRFIYVSNRPHNSSALNLGQLDGHRPAIFVTWHGQHFLLPYFYGPNSGNGLVNLVSKSADAELNALILQKAGHEVVRGSGGRVREATIEKGGVSATIALRNALKSGKDVAIIADISKGKPRQSGRGVISLAKISGRPIVPIAVATSRYKVVEGSWDKTTLNLPFGKRCLLIGNPIYVSADSSSEDLDMMRGKVDGELNRITENVYCAFGMRA